MASARGRTKRSRLAKRERLEARISPEQKELLQRAADLQGRTVSSFVIEQAQRAAEEAIRAHTVITLATQDSRAFAEALLNAPDPSEQLRSAAERYREAVQER
jgi:uncharacterized protein (DUF1778 family)